MDGFASNRNEELMMRVTLGTGPDATHVCPGGKRERAPGARAHPRQPPDRRGEPRAHRRRRSLLQGHPVPGRVATLSTKRGHIAVRTQRLQPCCEQDHAPADPRQFAVDQDDPRNHGVSTTLTAVVAGKTVSQRIAVKIF